MDKLIYYVNALLEQLELETIELSFYLINIVIFVLLFRYFLSALEIRFNTEDTYKLEQFCTLNNFILEYRLFKLDNSRKSELIKAMYNLIPFMNKRIVDRIINIDEIDVDRVDDLYNDLKQYFETFRINNKITNILNNHESTFGIVEDFFRKNGLKQLIFSFFYSIISWFAISSIFLMVYRFYSLTMVSRILMLLVIVFLSVYFILILFILDSLAYKGVNVNLFYILCIIMSIVAQFTFALQNGVTIVAFVGSYIFVLIMAIKTKKVIGNLQKNFA